MKLIAIGGNPASLSAASGVKRAHPDWEVEVFEQGPFISYASCGLPYYVEGKVKTLENLITITKEEFLKERNIPVHTFHKVTKVDINEKIVHVKNLQDNSEFERKYDILFIGMGGKPRPLPENPKHPRLFEVHTLNDGLRLRTFLKSNPVNSVVVIGGGYIGQEMLEVYQKLGVKSITLVGQRLVLTSKHVTLIKEEIEKNGVKIVPAKRVVKVIPLSDTALKVVLDTKEELQADLVQSSIGVIPETDLFRGSDLKLSKEGAIIIDNFGRTNMPQVYAGGDCATVYHRILKTDAYIPLAPAANRIGRIAGRHIAGLNPPPFTGVVGTVIWKVFNIHCARTGITEAEAKSLGYDAQTTLVQHHEIAHYYPGVAQLSLLLVFDATSHKLLGAEIIAPNPIGAKKIDVLATCLAAELTIDAIQDLDLAYAPPFSPVWDAILVAANVAINKCKKQGI